jgi:hypothetical protein
MYRGLRSWSRIESRMIQKHESKMNCEGESCVWEINSASCRKYEAKLKATKANIDELSIGIKYLLVDGCELL